MSAAAINRQAGTRPSISMRPGIRSSKPMILPKDGVGVTSTKSCSIFRIGRRRAWVRYPDITEVKSDGAKEGPCDGSGEYVSLLQSWRVRRHLLRRADMSWFLNPMSGKRRPIGWHRPTSSTRRPTSSGSARHDIIFKTLRPTTGIVSSCRPISAGHRLPRPTRYARYQARPLSALFYPSFGSLNLQAVRFSFAPYAMRDYAYG